MKRISKTTERKGGEKNMVCELGQAELIFVSDDEDDWQERSSQSGYYSWDSDMDDENVRENHRRGADDQWKREEIDRYVEGWIHDHNGGYAG